MSIRDMEMLGIGEPNDVGGTETEGTVNAKLNTVIRQTGRIYTHLFGEYVKSFGDGRMGDFVYDETPDAPFTDEYGRIVYYTESFNIPEGKTMRAKSSYGMVVWSRGDIVIEGILDISASGNVKGSKVVPNSIEVAGDGYPLAVGGGAEIVDNSSKCGTSGSIIQVQPSSSKTYSRTIPYWNSVSDHSSVTSGQPPCAYKPDYIMLSKSGLSITGMSNPGKIVQCGNPAGAVVLIAAGKIVINGQIRANGQTGSPYKNGTSPSSSSAYLSAGDGGNALANNGGGGAVTLIAKEIVKEGTINVSGMAATYVSAGSNGSGAEIFQNSSTNTFTAYAGTGAKAHTCGAGLAGNIKEYLLTGG